MIEGPQSRSAILGSNEVVEFNCTGCGQTLGFNITTDDQTWYYAVCGEKFIVGKNGVVPQKDFVVENKGIMPQTCTLYINTTLMNASEMLIWCKVGNSNQTSVFSDIATLTILESGREFVIYCW